jgi:hypothetical protein
MGDNLMTAVIQTGTDLFGPAKWIVDPILGSGTQTTIQAAITAASSGDTIFIYPGTYTENLTLKAGVNLTAFGSDSSLNATGLVIISGNCTMSTAGSVTISGIQLQTNSAALLTVSGSAASIVNLNNCYLNCTNATGISFSAANTSAAINISYCSGNLGTTGIGFHSSSSTGTITYNFSNFTNTGSSTTNTTISAGNAVFNNSIFNSPIGSTSTGALGFYNSEIGILGTTALAITGSATHGATYLSLNSGSATACTIGTGSTLNCTFCTFASSNTNYVSGAGAIIFTGLQPGTNASVSNSVTTKTGGLLVGDRSGTAPTSGYLGEQIRAVSGTVAVSNNTPTTITSISLTAGIWDISSVGQAQFSGNSTVFISGISPTNNSFTGGVNNDSYSQVNYTSGVFSVNFLSIPSYRVSLSSTTTYYLVSQVTFSTGSCNCIGRISATRVG